MSENLDLGKLSMPKLIRKMSVPAAVGFLVMNIYFIADSIFIGKYVGSIGIAAISVVMPITFLISSIGMAIGVGGSSMISRFLGANESKKANRTFGNMISLTIILSIIIMSVAYLFMDEVLITFGAQGDILPKAKEYFSTLILAIPMLAWSMMSNNSMRAEGQPKKAMMIMTISTLVNLVMDPIFIIGLDMGMKGAAIATALGYLSSTLYSLWFYLRGEGKLQMSLEFLALQASYIKEIFSIGFVTLARQGTLSLLSIVLNHSLFRFGGETAVAAYGIISRTMMFTNFPVLGITQGFLPIAGFNYGARHYDRVKSSIKLSIRYATLIASSIFVFVLLFPEQITSIFVSKEEVDILSLTPKAMILVFLATPLISTQLIGSAYFQAIGKAIPALLLTLSKQGFFLIPFLLILPKFFDLNGIWYAFPVSDILATIVTYLFLKREMKKNLNAKIEKSSVELT